MHRTPNPRKTIALAAVAAITAGAGLVAGSSAASAAAPQLHVIKTLSSAYVGPLQFAYHGDELLVSDAFSSALFKLGRKAPVATGGDPSKGGDISGIDFTATQTAYTTTNAESHTKTTLTILTRGTSKKVVADLSGFEAKHNPDKIISYGASTPSKLNAACRAELKQGGVPVAYTGRVDSHPYAVAALPGGKWAVADAGGNDLLQVDSHGSVSLLAVLPAQTVVISTAFAKANGAPDCVGVHYRFESVPTDVEVGSHGRLYVTLLPGGPEGPDSGNPGSVYRVDSRTSITRIAKGIEGATNLAIASNGDLYAASLSTGTIVRVGHDSVTTVAALPGVVGLEWARGHLYASTAPAVLGLDQPGRIVELG